MEAVGKKTRDSYFDNYKAFLIILVVMGHSMTAIKGDLYAVNYIKDFIYLFHMPAFAFVSGFFCRRPDFKKTCRTLLVPYLLMQTVMYFMSTQLWEKDMEKTYLSPGFTLWFLMSLIIWRSVLPLVKNIKGIVLIAFFLGILIGYDRSAGDLFAVSRTVVFFPFFVMGSFFNKDALICFAKKWWVKAAAVLILVAVFFLVRYYAEDIVFRLLEADIPYKKMHRIPFEWAWAYRAAAYVAGVLMIYLFGMIMPQKKYLFTRVGQHTMAIYLSHGIVVRTIRYCTGWNDFFGTKPGFFVLMAGCVLYCLIITSKPVIGFFSFIGGYLWKAWGLLWGLYNRFFGLFQDKNYNSYR